MWISWLRPWPIAGTGGARLLANWLTVLRDQRAHLPLRYIHLIRAVSPLPPPHLSFLFSSSAALNSELLLSLSQTPFFHLLHARSLSPPHPNPPTASSTMLIIQALCLSDAAEVDGTSAELRHFDSILRRNVSETASFHGFALSSASSGIYFEFNLWYDNFFTNFWMRVSKVLNLK